MTRGGMVATPGKPRVLSRRCSWFCLRITTCQNLAFLRRFLEVYNVNQETPESYVSRQDAKSAKGKGTSVMSSLRSWRLGARTGFGCGRRPRWGLCGPFDYAQSPPSAQSHAAGSPWFKNIILSVIRAYVVLSELPGDVFPLW